MIAKKYKCCMMIAVKLDDELFALLNHAVERTKSTKSDIVRDALRKYLQDDNKPKHVSPQPTPAYKWSKCAYDNNHSCINPLTMNDKCIIDNGHCSMCPGYVRSRA